MKNTVFIILALIIIGIKANAQGFNEYGVFGDLHVPQFPDRFRTTLGFGVGFYGNYQFTEKYSLLTKTAFRNINHFNLDLSDETNFQDINLTLAAGLNLQQLAGTKLLMGMQPSRVILANTAIGNSRLSDLENRNSIGLYGGIQIDLNAYSKLEVSYTLPLQKTNNTSYIDAIPPMVSVGLYANFNLRGAKETAYEKMQKTLADLQDDTLYFINRACEGELSNEDLEGLLIQYYDYSAFKVLRLVDIENGILPKNPIHFAVIGQYYAGTGEPLTTGIYLLDKNMNNVRQPYDPYVPIYNSSLNCMGSFSNISKGLIRFNSGLKR